MMKHLPDHVIHILRPEQRVEAIKRLEALDDAIDYFYRAIEQAESDIRKIFDANHKLDMDELFDYLDRKERRQNSLFYVLTNIEWKDVEELTLDN